MYKKLSNFAIEEESKDLDNVLGTILKIWTNGLISNEGLLVVKIVEIIRNSWLIFIKSKPFMNLPKSLIIKLCQDCADIFPNQNTITNSNMQSIDTLSHALSKDKESDSSIDKLDPDSGFGTPTSGTTHRTSF